MFKKGYTLIEILVVISIIALLMQGGLASYRTFSRRQLIVNVRRQVEGDLRLAQQQSLSGFKCESSNATFSGVSFTLVDRTSYLISAVCSDGARYPIKAASIPANSIFVRPADREIIFLPLGNGTNIGRWQLGICAYDKDITSLVVSQTGEIFEESFNTCKETGGGGSAPSCVLFADYSYFLLSDLLYKRTAVPL